MRRALAVALGSAVVLVAQPALALGLCDPDGHFCIQVDATSATACDLTRPGGLDRHTCAAEDQAVRDRLRAGPVPPLRAFMLRFDSVFVLVAVSRLPAEPELADDELAARGSVIRANNERSVKFDAFAPPQASRIHDVQVIRFDSQWTLDGKAVEEVNYEVHARDAMYVVGFFGARGQPLAAFADSAIATVDALPASRPTGAGEALRWLLRGLFAAVVLAGAFLWLRRRKGNGMASADLWPR